jgi:hypothetical protein
MAQKKARIRLEVTGAQQLQKVLRGIREGEKRGSREDRQRDKRKSADEATEEQKRSRTRKRHRDQNLTEEQRAARIKKLIERDVTREVEQQARARARAERQAARERASTTRGQRIGRTLVRGTATAIGGAMGAGQALMGRVGEARGALGVSSAQERIQAFIRAEQDFIRLAGQGGLSPERQRELWGQIGTTARETNTDPEAIIEGLTVAQNRFSDLEGFAANIEEIAKVAQVSKAPMADWIGAIGEFQRQMGVTTAEVPELIGMVAQAARDGSVEAGDIAASFSDQMARFAMFRGGRGGMAQARELMGVAEVTAVGAGTKGADTRTLVSNLMTALSESRVQRSIERATGNRELFDDRGILRVSFAELFGQLSEARNDPFRSDQQMQRMGIGSSEARTALGAIISQFERGSAANPLRDFENTSAAEGNAMIASTFDQMMSSDSGRAIGIEIAGQAAMMQNGSEVVRALNAVVGPLDELTSQYPLATQAIGTFVDALQGAGMGVAAANFLGLGSSPAALPAAAAPGLGLGASTGALSSLLGLIGLGGAVGARGGYELAEGMTGSDSVFAGGMPGMRRTLERERERGGEGAVRDRIRRDTAFMNEGVIGLAMRHTGGDRVVRVVLEQSSIAALERGIGGQMGREAAAFAARHPGGPARRGGGE